LIKKTPEWNNKPYSEPNSTWAVKLLLDGSSVLFYDRENPADAYELTLTGLIKGIQKNLEERPFSCDKENWDAEDCDCIVQYALFNEIVFG
jgi:hypothetical protein